MEEKDKKEIVKMMGEALEKNVLPTIDSVDKRLIGVDQEFKKVKTKLIKIDQRLEDVEGTLDKVERRLERAIDRYDEKIQFQDERLTVLERKPLRSI